VAIYPTLFGHVELPDPTPRRYDRSGTKPVGIRLVRPTDLYPELRRSSSRSRS
jgi:hypothetical protein